MSEIKVDTLTGKTTANDITVTVGATATMSLEQGLAKVWSNFNGTSFAGRSSFNISTYSDNGSGDYTISMTNAFSNVDDVALSANSPEYNTTNVSPATCACNNSSASNIEIEVINISATKVDRSAMQIIGVGDLA